MMFLKTTCLYFNFSHCRHGLPRSQTHARIRAASRMRLQKHIELCKLIFSVRISLPIAKEKIILFVLREWVAVCVWLCTSRRSTVRVKDDACAQIYFWCKYLLHLWEIHRLIASQRRKAVSLSLSLCTATSFQCVSNSRNRRNAECARLRILKILCSMYSPIVLRRLPPSRPSYWTRYWG